MSKSFYNIFFNSKEINIYGKVKRSIVSYFLIIFLILLTFPVIKLIDFIIINFIGLESVVALISKSRQLIDTRYSFVSIAIIVPLIEEIIFRLHLKPKLINMQISLSLIIIYVINGSILNINIYSSVFWISIVTTISVLYLVRINYGSILKLYNTKIKTITIFSIFLFGLIHLVNIKHLHYEISPLYFFFIFPQIIMGYFISNLRLKLGFFWGYGLHVMINTISIIIH